jgi:hypothetical protein
MRTSSSQLDQTQTDHSYQLAYPDFWMLSRIPEQVRDGLVCAVAYSIFCKDVEVVANLFGELYCYQEKFLEGANALH